MPKVLIHFFSGTGNSLLAAKQISQELETCGYDSIFHAVENGRYDTHETFTLHMFFFPVYATATPHIMLNYIRNLPAGKNTKAAVISTNGRISTRFRDGYQGWALHQARLHLYLKKYHVFFSDTLDYPSNITAILPPRKAEHNKEIILQASKKIPLIAEKIAHGRTYHRSFFFPHSIWSIPFGILYSLFGRRIMGKMFAAQSSCTLCSVCIEKCPVNAIRISHGQVRWGWNCEGCMRCINSCPEQAIQSSAVRILLALAASAGIPFFIVQPIIPVEILKGLPAWGGVLFHIFLYSISSIVFFVLLEWFIFKISHVPILKKVLNWGYTKFYGRYHAKQCEDDFLNKKER
jgi:ferredoxin